MQPSILIETKDYLIINKPAGLVVHADGKTNEPTLVDWVVKERPEMVGIGEPIHLGDQTIDRPGIVHRLDRETSGVMVLAKTAEYFDFLKNAFKNRNLEKKYTAFVWGQFKEDEGIVDAPIGRSSGDFRRWQSGRGIRGEEREAITKWKSLFRFEDEKGEPFSFLELFPKTGRTHQLRVHMKYLQRPIVCDGLYAPSKRQALGFSRVALHARSISFKDLSGNDVYVEAPYPADFEEALARYTKI